VLCLGGLLIVGSVDRFQPAMEVFLYRLKDVVGKNNWQAKSAAVYSGYAATAGRAYLACRVGLVLMLDINLPEIPSLGLLFSAHFLSLLFLHFFNHQAIKNLR